ncbi:hypothetical protein [Prosthecobacter sp.]|uniref:hypothetical protein n=1 Tax=Prosthecobacter sp. TaxID=1965333 RepID=UPI0024894104|nr:hypothetical protein [Prosthecobacter sp.]MDI1311404.1 hypothetical protein [Prosthecobacter sp.]
MLDFRFSSLLKAVLLLACLLAAFEYLSKADKLNEELAELKARAETARETADLRRKEWTEINEAKAKLEQMTTHMENLIRQRDILDTQERRLTGEIKYLAESMTAVVVKARTAATGTVIPELLLEGRTTLHNAKIFKINEDSISFLHEDGVANLHVKAEEIPIEFIKKYDLGSDSIIRRLKHLVSEMRKSSLEK